MRSGQFWLAHRPSLAAEFETPTHVGSLDLPGKDPAAPTITNNRDAAPFVTFDERYLIFSRADDLYEATR